MKRDMITDEQIERAKELIVERLHAVIEQKGKDSFASAQELRGVLNTEVDEFNKEVRVHGNSRRLKHELCDVAITCIFGIACINAQRSKGK